MVVTMNNVPLAAAPAIAAADRVAPTGAVAYFPPNWAAAVMGTGIVAVAAASLPDRFAGLRGLAIAVWMLAAVLLVAFVVVTIAHWVRYPAIAAGPASDPTMAHFYGAPPMALLTVGAGTLLIGRDVLGLRIAVDADWTLWTVGTILGLICAATVPYLVFTRHVVRLDSPFGGWLMPIVPPMVSASTGALLVPHTPSGQARLSLLLGCYALFGLSLIASMIVITLIWYRLALCKVGPARLVPTLWIVLGPLGQSITAANLLGGVAHLVLPTPYATGLQVFGVVYGVPVLGFALLWAGIAGAITVRTARAGLPFSLTWWSFTFPIGTCVTGLTGLALHTGADVFRVGADGTFAVLVLAWSVVALRTLGGVITGALFCPPVQGG